jgi:hypothetical protein
MVKRLLLLLLLLIPLAIADNHELTYDDFLQNPTAADFQSLSEANQDIYIRDLANFNGDNFAMAQDYFTKGNKINENPEPFSKFMGSQSIDIGVAGKGDFDIAITSKDGKITSAIFKNEKVSIDLNNFKAIYSYVIDDNGELQLISDGKEYPITGTVKKGDYAELVISEGSIAGFKIKNGDIRILNGKIYGVADKFGEMIFQEGESGFPGIFIYDITKNEITLKQKPHFDPEGYSLEDEDEIIFYSRPNNMIINSPFKTVFIKQGEALDNMKVEYKEGKPVNLIALKNNGRAMIGGISHRIDTKGTKINLCYDIDCYDKNENSFYYGNKEFAIKGRGFESVLDKQSILNFKAARKLVSGDPYTTKKLDRPVIKTKLWAESMFLGSNKEKTSDYHDFVLLAPNQGSLRVKSNGKQWSGKAKGKIEIQNGYWSISSNGDKVHKNPSFNPHNHNLIGADVIDLEIDFKMSNDKEEKGYKFIDEKRRPDLFKYPFRYTGINPNGFNPQNEEEFRQYYIFNLDLLKGQPLDFWEGRRYEEIDHTNEFVCVDVVASAYKLTTGVDMLKEKEKLGKSRGFEWGTQARRNWELRPFFAASKLFDSKEFPGEDFVKSVPSIHGKTHTKNTKIKVPEEDIHFPGSRIAIDWEKEYGLDKGQVQFVMFEKQEVKCSHEKGCEYTDGSQAYHIVPTFWEGGKWITIQAPGECRSKGVCEIPLDDYVNSNRCQNKDQLYSKNGCYAHYGVRQVTTPKVQSRQIAQN